MIKKIQGFFDGIVSAKYIFKSLIETIFFYFAYLKLFFKQLSLTVHLKKNINLSISRIRESYMFVGNYHLEINTFKGIFIQNTHRIRDNYPFITLVDKSMEEIQDTFIALDGSFCPLDYVNIDFTKKDFNFEKKFDSISLTFVLDEIYGKKNIEEFVVKIKSLLLPGGVVFGVTVPGTGINHDAKSKNYIFQQNKKNIWANKHTSAEDISNIFEKHFDNIGIAEVGSTLVFRLATYNTQPDLEKHRPTLETVEGKKIKINKPREHLKPKKNTKKWH